MEDARAQEENSMFETSHVLGALLVSSPLLQRCWEKCAAAAAGAAAPGFVHGAASGTAYVAFYGAHAALSMLGPGAAAGGGAEVFAPVGLGSGAARPLFAPLVAAEAEAAEPLVVQALALQCFLRLCGSPDFQMVLNQIRGKAVVFTGHSLGGAVAALAALHYLCSAPSSQTGSAAPAILCVTFGSPLLGNEALSRAVLRERWGGNFCHVVSQHDVVPRLLFCPLGTVPPHIIIRMQPNQWPSQNCHAAAVTAVTAPISQTEQEALHQLIQMHLGAVAMEQQNPADPVRPGTSPYRPFGTYALCSEEGAVCVDNPTAAVQMLYATFVSPRPPAATPDAAHSCYGDLVLKMPQHLLLRRRPRVDDAPAASNYDTGISLALEASGIDAKGAEAAAARQWLKTCKRMGCSPSLNCANLAIRLARITPRRAQIEWYKALFDGDTGYYDAFKQRRSPKKYASANMNRLQLGNFWDDVLAMFESSQLPHDFPRRSKWVNAARFYQLLVEPLDIAEYHRNGLHRTQGGYIAHGRQRRYEVFDKWWKEKGFMGDTATQGQAAARRSKCAGLTQDPCFWARVEEAQEWMEGVKSERDALRLVQKLEKLRDFEWYARDMVKSKEVSIDVLAPMSSYTLWMEAWKELKSRDELKALIQL